MSNEAERSERSGGLSRRTLLAAVGLSGLAGCSGLDELTGEKTIFVDSDEFDVTDPDSGPSPPVPPSVPVQIAPDYLSGNRERVVTLLSKLPVTLGPEEIPNGYIRRKVTEAATDATTKLDHARTAETPLLALQALQFGRKSARFAAAGWAFVDQGVSETALRKERDTATVEARKALENHEYLGADRVRAVAVHSSIETQLNRAVRSETDGGPEKESDLLRVAAVAQSAESARAHLTAGQHLTEQFARSLPKDAESVRTPITDAGEKLFERVRSKRSELPPEPTAEDWGVPQRVVDELRWRVDTEETSLSEAVGPASTVGEALRWLTHFRALDWTTRKVDAGEIGSVESAAELKSVREAAYDALGRVQTNSPAPALSQPVATDAGWKLVTADRRLTSLTGEVSVSQLDDPVTDYYVGWALARSVPEACRTVVETLQSI